MGIWDEETLCSAVRREGVYARAYAVMAYAVMAYAIMP